MKRSILFGMATSFVLFLVAAVFVTLSGNLKPQNAISAAVCIAAAPAAIRWGKQAPVNNYWPAVIIGWIFGIVAGPAFAAVATVVIIVVRNAVLTAIG